MKETPKNEFSYLSIIESINDALIVKNLSGTIIFVNKAAEKLFGYLPGEMTGKNGSIIFPPFKVAEEKVLIEKILLGEKIENYETNRIDKAGNILYVNISLSGLKDEQGNIIGIIIIIRNLQDKKATGKFQAFLESLPEAMVIVNKLGLIIFVNTHAEKLFGYERGELIGTELETLIHKRYKPIYQQQREYFTEHFDTKKVDAGFEFFCIRKDGTEFSAHVSLKPLYFEDGMFISAMIKDNTARKIELEKLKQSEEKLNTIFHSSPVGILISVLATQKVIEANEAFFEISGYRPEEAIGHSTVELNLVDPVEREKIVAEVREKGSVVNKELLTTTKSGEKKSILLSTKIIVINNEECIVSILYDISIRKKAENELKEKTEELERSNKELEQFAYVASHDLQEPLRNITTYVSLLEQKQRECIEEESHFFLDIIVHSAEKMKKLIKELSNFALLDKERTVEHVDCNKVIKEVLADLDNIIEENQAKIQVGNLPVINSNEVEMHLLFKHLLGNAIKFKKNDVIPEIRILCVSADNHWKFSISDNGIGIEEEYRDKVFLLYQRLHTAEEYPGLGIGLATCKKIIEINKGKIWIDSKPGVGTTVYFTIPKL